MCVVSMIGDNFRDRWIRKPWYPNEPLVPDPYTSSPWNPDISRKDFEDLKKEVEILKDLLKAGKAYDEKNGEPNCEIDEKMKILRKIAKAVGVDLDEVLKPVKP